MNIKPKFRCVLHGSFRKHWAEIKKIHQLFIANGIEVLAPTISEIKTIENGFAMLETDIEKDQRLIELLYLHNLKRLGENGFSYFVNPVGYLGKSTSYELGIAQMANVPCFFAETPADHPVYIRKNAVIDPESLVQYIKMNGALPEPSIQKNEQTIHQLWNDLVVGSVVAVGGIIEYDPVKPQREKEILLVKTHKWGGRYSIVGEQVYHNERLNDALIRGLQEEIGLRAKVGQHICTFDQIKNSGYHMSGVQHIFVDKVVKVTSKKVRLNEEAEDYIWIPPQIALKELPIEPNARHTLELYTQMHVD